VDIRIRVRLYAVLREAAGTGELELEVPAGATCEAAMRELFDRLPALRRFGDHLACAVNQEYADRQTVLRDGDELALIPPVSGG